MYHFGYTLILFSVSALLSLAVPDAIAQEKQKENEKDAEVPEAKTDDDATRSTLAFDPGSHTRPISALAFSKDQSKLITVGWDYSVQIWSTTTGERLDILRLPAYGRDNGFDHNRWNVAAVSPDGEFVAIGGAPKFLKDDTKTHTRLLIVDVAKRRVRKAPLPVGPQTPITALTFSADGDRLAIGTGGDVKSAYIIDDVIRLMRVSSDNKRPSLPKLVAKDLKGDVLNIALSSNGNRLVFGEDQGPVNAWDVSGKVPDRWKQLCEIKAINRTDVLAWAPDGSHFARAWVAGGGTANRGIELRAADGKQLKIWTYDELTPGFGAQPVAATFRYLAADRLFVSAHGGISSKDGYGALGVILNPKNGKTTRLFAETTGRAIYTPFGAVSEKADLAATTTTRGLEAAIYRLSDGKIVARCGNRTPIPNIVGWSNDPKKPAIAWSDQFGRAPFNSTLEHLDSAFDLAKVEPIGKFAPADFAFRRFAVGDWNLEYKLGAGVYLDVTLKKGTDAGKKIFNAAAHSVTLIPNGEKSPLVAYARHDQAYHMGSFLHLIDANGKVIANWLPVATTGRDMVSSPDGRYVLASTGTHRLSIYKTDGSQFPFLNLVRANGEWIVWTPQGYYAASPGGEKLIGWTVTNGANEFATYYPVERFAKHYHRPDVIKLAIERGSVELALQELKTKPTEVETILPPKAELQSIKQMGAKVQVKAMAQSGIKDKPVVKMNLLLDGRPLSEGRGRLIVEPGKPAEAIWEIEVPGGKHELTLLASTADNAAISAPLIVIGPRIDGQQPTIYRLCVGVNDYDETGLKLNAAVKDATAVFDAFEKQCVGPYNRFGTAKGQLILNKDATRQGIVDAIGVIRKAARPGDLVVLFFAGHGLKQENDFYLLTKEANTSKSLQGFSLSGEDLRTALSDIECPVLLIMDACHSATGVKSFRPATDDLTRSLTNESAGVTIMAAAMSHEIANADTENGYFTAGLIKALKVEEGVPFDPYERALFTHHIYSVVYSEVRRASNGKQNPFLNSPWTVPPIAVRDIAKP